MEKARACFRNLDIPISRSWGNKLAKAAYRTERGEGGQDKIARAEIQIAEKRLMSRTRKKSNNTEPHPSPSSVYDAIPAICLCC